MKKLLAFCILLATFLPETQARDLVDLSGQWLYELDPNDSGISAKWYGRKLKESGFKLPGTTTQNKLGDDHWNKIDPEFNAENVGLLRQKYTFTGSCWLQKEVNIPADWDKKKIQLFLERVIFYSKVWVGNNEVPAIVNDSLLSPHKYDLTKYLSPGKHRLTIMIDNRDRYAIGNMSHAYSEHTQSIWNGIVGRIELEAFDKVWIKDVQAYPDIANKRITFKIKTGNATASSVKVKLNVSAKSSNSDKKHAPAAENYSFTCEKNGSENTFHYNIGDGMLLWDEHDPALYNLTLNLNANSGGEDFTDKQTIRFGMREFKAVGTYFTINGKKTQLRGTLDCCIYPLTGHPPMDKASWIDIFNTIKSYGLNHVRYHSWCPPEAAFLAADEVGMYLQPETSMMWLGLGDHANHEKFFTNELLRLLKNYGNSPSFCLYQNGNECGGDEKNGLLQDKLIALGKKTDPRHLYSYNANGLIGRVRSEDQFIVGPDHRANLKANGDYKNVVDYYKLPFIHHEIGQWVVYPSMEEISKYTGALRPVNLLAIENDLKEKHMLDLVPKYIQGSGMLSIRLYRNEIESTLRTADFGGYQSLGLQDFPGQSTAIVGILDSFWDSKGLITPEKYREFNAPIVLTLQQESWVYKTSDQFWGKVQIANCGPRELTNAVIDWSISHVGGTLASGSFTNEKITYGTGIDIGNIKDVKFSSLTVPTKCTVKLSLKGTKVTNSWDIYVYPENQDTVEKSLISKGDVLIASRWDNEVEKHLAKGGNVLLTVRRPTLKSPAVGRFNPTFWSPLFFGTDVPCGIYADTDNGIFNKFPTDFWADYQWEDLLDNSCSMVIDELPPSLEPTVMVIPDWWHNKRLSNLFEAKMDKGKIVVCSIDIENDLERRHAARALRHSILSYMSSDFDPAQTLSSEQIKALFIEPPVSFGKKTTASSEASPEYSADKGNDASTSKRWCAADGSFPQWWMLDLGAQHSLVGSEIKWEFDGANYHYKIEASSDQETWTTITDKTNNSETSQLQADNFNVNARYVRVTVTGIDQGYWASFNEFTLFDENTAPTASASSEQENYEASKAIDNNPNTMWHTRWSPQADKMPHEFVIDLKNKTKISGLSYVKRKDNGNGIVGEYEVYVSNDGKTWGEPLAKDTWTNAYAQMKAVFQEPVMVRYVKLVVLKAIDGTGFASAAEVSVIKTNSKSK